MLDLEPRIHFDEPECVGAQSGGAVGDEFHSPGAAVPDRFGGDERGFAEDRA